MLDNTLWRGQVADPEKVATDEGTKALYDVVAAAKANPNVEMHSLMLADGLTIIRKK